MKRRPRACPSGKVSFRTYGAALAALRRIHRDDAQAAAPNADPPRSGYRCGECGSWHLTRQDPARQTRPWPLT